MNTPAHGPYNPDPHSPYGQQLQQRLRAHAGPRAEETETGNRVTRAFKAVFTELENAAAGPPPMSSGPGRAPSPSPSASHLANASEDFFARLDAGVRELATETERATERLGFTQRRPSGPPGTGTSTGTGTPTGTGTGTSPDTATGAGTGTGAAAGTGPGTGTGER